MRKRMVCETPHADAKVQLGWALPHSPQLTFANPQPDTLEALPIYSHPEGHLLTIAPTGMGKGRSAIIPTLLTYPGSVIVVDPKGEAAAITARQRRKFGKVITIDPFYQVTQTPDTFNPLDLHEVSSNSVVEQALLVSDLLQLDKGRLGKEPFWDIRATALLAGVLAYILSAKPKEERHLGTLKNIFAADDIIYTLAVALDTQKKMMDPFAYKEIAQILQMPEITRGGVVATAQQHVYLFDDTKVLESIKKTSFDLEAVVRGEPVTIYLVLPPTKLKSHGVLLRMWIASLLYAMFERDTLPELPTLFMIDEAAQLGTLEVLRTAITLMRGYGVRCWTFWQDLSQLKHLYPHDWQTIINNAAVLQTFGITTNLMARDLSDVLGDVSPQALLMLGRDQQFLVQPGGKVDITTKLDYLQDEGYQGLYNPHPMFKARQEGVRQEPEEVPTKEQQTSDDTLKDLMVTLPHFDKAQPGPALDRLLAKLTACPHVYPFSTEDWAAKYLLEHFEKQHPTEAVEIGITDPILYAKANPETRGEIDGIERCAVLMIENRNSTMTFSNSLACAISITILRVLLRYMNEDEKRQLEGSLAATKDVAWTTLPPQQKSQEETK